MIQGLLAGLLSSRRRTGTSSAQTYSATWLAFDPLTPRSAARLSRQALMCYYISFPPGGMNDLGAVNATDVDTRWPGGVANSTDLLWYRNNTPGNTIGNSAYVFCAGFVRDRPAAQYQRAKRTEPKTPSTSLTRTPGGVTFTAQRDWRVLDRVTELQDMLRAGLTVAQVDTIGLPKADGEWNPTQESSENPPTATRTYTGMPLRVRQQWETYEAASMVREQGYPLTLSPYFDGVTTGTREFTADPTRPGQFIADWINWMDDRFPGVHATRQGPSGPAGVLASVYAPELAPAWKATGGLPFWQSVRALCTRPVKWLFVYQLAWISPQTTYASITSAAGRWGERNPVTTARENTDNRQMGDKLAALSPGVEYAAVVTAADTRPDQLKFDDSRGFEQIVESWATARGAGVVSGQLLEGQHRAAELVHMPTWSDYREGAQWMPTVNHGWCFLDVSHYFMLWWQTGTPPVILRPTVYMSRRTQLVDAVELTDGTRVHLRHALPSLADFPTVGSSDNPLTPLRKTGQGYIDLSTDRHYRWDGTAYVELPSKFPNTYLPYSQGGVQRPQRDYCGLCNPSTPSSDRVWFVAFLPAGTTYTATTVVCGVTSTRTLQPGVQRFDLPLTGIGTTSVVVTNAVGVEVARIDPDAIPAVSKTLTRQDLNYHAAGSRDSIARPLPPV